MMNTLITADLETFSVEAWLEALETRECPQETAAVVTLDAFYDEICSMVS
jgi:hypothetical protein